MSEGRRVGVESEDVCQLGEGVCLCEGKGCMYGLERVCICRRKV